MTSKLFLFNLLISVVNWLIIIASYMLRPCLPQCVCALLTPDFSACLMSRLLSRIFIEALKSASMSSIILILVIYGRSFFVACIVMNVAIDRAGTHTGMGYSSSQDVTLQCYNVYKRQYNVPCVF